MTKCYIGKNTLVTYIEEESVECNYIEVCETVESTECRNWVPKRKIVNSDLVYSPAQVTEHRRVELKDQDVPEEDQVGVREVKSRLSRGVLTEQSRHWSYAISYNACRHRGLTPHLVKKPYTLPLKHYSWVQQEVETLEQAGIIKKSLSPWASQLLLFPRIRTW